MKTSLNRLKMKAIRALALTIAMILLGNAVPNDYKLVFVFLFIAGVFYTLWHWHAYLDFKKHMKDWL